MSDHDQSLWRKTCQERVESTSLTDGLTVDLAIVGGGYTGLSAALTAAQVGASVCVLEAHEVGHGGSGRNAGLVNAGLWMPPDQIRAELGQDAGDALIALLAAAPEEVFRLIETQSIDCAPVRAGTLHCAHSAAGLRDLQSRYAQLTASGAPVELISAQDARARTGSASFHGALFDPRAGVIQPLAYAKGLARAAVQAGAKLFENSPVQSMRHVNGVWELITPQGIVRARAVLQATNGYHQGLTASVPDYVPIYYFQYATAPLSDTLRAGILPKGEGGWDTGLIMTSFRLESTGRFIIGGMGDLGHIGQAAHKGWARRKLAELYPQLADQPLIEGWHGRIAMTSDHLPKITEIGPNSLSVHGYSGRGIGPGTVFGSRVAESLLNDDPSRLPVPPLPQYSESWTGLRRAFFEAGAAVTHLVKARF